MVLLFLLIIIVALGLTHFIALKLAGQNKWKRIGAGVIVLLLAPVVSLVTGISVSPFDSYGFATGVMMVIYGFLFAANGILIIMIGLFTRAEPQKV